MLWHSSHPGSAAAACGKAANTLAHIEYFFIQVFPVTESLIHFFSSSVVLLAVKGESSCKIRLVLRPSKHGWCVPPPRAAGSARSAPCPVPRGAALAAVSDAQQGMDHTAFLAGACRQRSPSSTRSRPGVGLFPLRWDAVVPLSSQRGSAPLAPREL